MAVNPILVITPCALIIWHRKRRSKGFGTIQLIFAALVLVTFICIYTSLLFTASNSRHSSKVIPGWEPNRSRMAELCVKPNESTAIIDGSSICASTSPLLLLVVVCSDLANHRLRMAIRSTWASNTDQSVKVVFFFGITRNVSLQHEILTENETYKDIIQEDFLDTYFNLTIKSIMMLKWYTTHCKQARFLLKTDDDIFLRLATITKSLSQPLTSGMNHETLLGGSLIRDAAPVADSKDKWFMPSYMYPGDTYPNYLSGTCYLMSHQVAVRLYSASIKVRIIHMEDIYLTGICAQVAGIKPISLVGFTFKHMVSLTCGSFYIMSHRVTPDEMVDLWKTNSPCSNTSEESIFLEENGLLRKTEIKLLNVAYNLKKFLLWR